jgi:hypothetical protein
MVLYDLHRVWDDVPFYGKAIAGFFICVQIGAVLTWLSYMRKEVMKQQKNKFE